MKAPANDAPLVLVKWYAYAKWVLERVEGFPKSQRFILGQRLANHVNAAMQSRVQGPAGYRERCRKRASVESEKELRCGW